MSKPCPICKFKFRKEIKDKTVIITLIETKTEKEIGYIRFADEIDYIELEYIVVKSEYERQGFGSKLMRVIKAIAKAQNKPIYLDAFTYTVGFFIKHQFIMTDERQRRYSELIHMGWKA